MALKPSGKPDLALIATTAPCIMAGVYTQNIVCATSIDWNRSRTPSQSFRAIIINSGNANACTGQQGKTDNESMARATAKILAWPSPRRLASFQRESSVSNYRWKNQRWY